MNLFTKHRFKIIAATVIVLFFTFQAIFLGAAHLTTWVVVLEVLDAFLLLIVGTLLDVRTALLARANEYSKNLEDATHQLLEKTNQLEETLTVKNRLLRTLNHDIRSPLSSIMLASDVLLKRNDNQVCYNLALNINKSADRIMQMIMRYLQGKWNESVLPKFTLEDIDIRTKLKIVVLSHQQVANKKNIALNLVCQPDIPMIRSDRTAVLQIFDNLISNAIKFSPPSTVVTLRLFKTDVAVVTEIEDQGPGLTDEDQRVLYTAYAKRSTQPTAGEPTTGVGLSIVKELVDALGATIAVRSQPGHGTVFTIHFPINKPAENQ
jgi:two-component system sensor histidine kinase/response regulator